MSITAIDFFKTNVMLRITALWAFSEAFMGGILHGLKIPFAGLVLSFVASVCITLIALGRSKNGAILKATLLVIAVKFILSPHTPPMAYIAVLIQGLMGELLFLNKRFFIPAAFILTLFSLLYSAFQHLLILTILFGKQFWVAIDIFLNKITQSFSNTSFHYSLFIVIGYLGCYLIAGIIGGLLNVRMIQSVQQGEDINVLLSRLNGIQNYQEAVTGYNEKNSKKGNLKIAFGILMMLMLVASYLPFFHAGFSQYKVLEIILRGAIIVLLWIALINPLLKMQMKKWVARYQQKKDSGIQEVLAMMPGIKMIVQQSWALSQNSHKWLRFKSFIHNTVLLIVHHEQ